MKHICESCENGVSINDKFCPSCGSMFDELTAEYKARNPYSARLIELGKSVSNLSKSDLDKLIKMHASSLKGIKPEPADKKAIAKLISMKKKGGERYLQSAANMAYRVSMHWTKRARAKLAIKAGELRIAEQFLVRAPRPSEK